MRKDLDLNVGARYVCLPALICVTANMAAVHLRPHILRALCRVPAIYDRHNKEAWTYILPRLHCHRLGCDHGCECSPSARQLF